MMLNRRQYGQWVVASGVALSAESARGFWANDTINVACLGTGGRCRHLMQRLAKVPGVRISGVCDIWEPRRAEAKTLADAAAVVAADFRQLLDRPDVDAVLIGAPDHWHVPMTIAACEAGKDVYVEKPLTHRLDEGEAVVEAVRRTQRVVQVGTQQRSIPHLIEARALVQQGALGKVHKVHMTWNRNQERWSRTPPQIDPKTLDWKAFLGNAPAQPFDAYRMLNWRRFWDFGGGIFTDLMVHWYDTARWMLDLPDVQRAVSIGHHLATEGLWQTPDTVQTLLDFGPAGPQAHFDGTFVTHYGRAHLALMGSDATLVCDRGGYELVPQSGKSVAARTGHGSANHQRGLDFYEDVDCGMYHLVNWVESMRARRDPACPVEEGVRSAAGAHLANLALPKV